MNIFTFTKLARVMLLSAVMVIVAVWLSGCGGGGKNPSELVGQWIFMSGDTDDKPEEIELFKDGTGVVDKGSVTWKVENKRLVFLSSSIGLSCNYKVSGYELILAYDNGDSAKFLNKNKENEYYKERDELAKKEVEREKKEAKQSHENISSYFTDSRDGQKYRAVKIGGKSWMAENLNYQTGNSWCYNNDASYCKSYGRLYDWNTAKTVCPTGWHLPSHQEWNGMVTAAGGDVAGKKLKSTYGWAENGNGSDDFGFSALPANLRQSDGSFGGGVGGNGFWWTATESGGGKAYCHLMVCGDETKVITLTQEGSYGLSVRCVEDNGNVSNNLETPSDEYDDNVSKKLGLEGSGFWMEKTAISKRLFQPK